jgi:hypothetical protein
VAKVAKANDRGYGRAHRRLRKRWARVVAVGDAYCGRCGKWISPEAPWDLGHHDFDRSVYTGPEHRRCNRATEKHGVKALRRRARRRFSRIW